MRERPVDKSLTPPIEHRSGVSHFLGSFGEVIFLIVITVATYALYSITAANGGRYAMLAGPTINPFLGQAGIYLPFLLWGFYIVMHKGWLKMGLAFGALLAAMFVLLLIVSYFYYNAPFGKIVYQAYQAPVSAAPQQPQGESQ